MACWSASGSLLNRKTSDGVRPIAPTAVLLYPALIDPEAIKQAKADAIKAGYSNAAVGAIGRTPSDVFLFSKLPEADQQAILRQANKDEFERYIGHAHMKLKGPMRDELVGNQAEGPAPGPSSAPAPRPAGPVPQSAAPPPSSQPTPPPPPAQAWPPAPPPTFNDIRMR